MWKSLLFAALLGFATQAQAATPRERLLVSPAWLVDHQSDKDLVILHVGTEAGYRAKHIPGARLVTLKSISIKSPDGLMVQLPPAAELRLVAMLARRIGTPFNRTLLSEAAFTLQK